jgi:hypothetical protein
MKKYAIILGLILTFGISAFAQNIEILETGGFHGEEVTAKTGESWLGLFKQGENYSLLPVVLTVENFHDAIVDNDESEKTGKEVTVLGQDKPVFLIRGKGFTQSRVVKTVFSGAKPIDNIFNETYEFAGKKYNLKVQTIIIRKKVSTSLNETSKLILSDGKTEQTIYSIERCDDCHWQINWAGDLDGDGKLDFYLNLSDHYNVANLKLFLSSEAESGKLVKEVAEFTTTGC